MQAATYSAGIVLALLVGVAFALLWQRVQAAGAQARAAEESTRPVADTLVRIEAQMHELEAQRRQMLGGLEANIGGLAKETAAISQALRSPNARGRWGELTLRRVAELSGMSPYCDFTEQATSNGKRPDMLVRLPGGRTLPVDAKAPLGAYLDAQAAPDEAQKLAALDRHAQQLWRHVTTLASREYWAQFDAAPELVVLFLPGVSACDGQVYVARQRWHMPATAL